MLATTAEAAIQPQPIAEPRRRGRAVEFRPPDAFHQCWFPVALTSEVPAGKVVGLPFLDGRVIVWRDDAGVAHVHSAYCRHLGADLSVGRIVDGRVQCPFHHWQYGAEGACVHVPAGDAPPHTARLMAYPTAESLGIVWAFNGETPLYPVPRFDVDESELVVDAFRNPAAMPVDLPIVFMNTFDLQHFRVVHGMPLEVDPDSIREEQHTLFIDVELTAPEFGKVMQHRRLWGVNTITIESTAQGRPLHLLHSLCAVGPNATQGILVSATPKAAPGDAEGAAVVQSVLAAAREYSLRLVAEDAPIFETIRFRRDCLTASDRLLAYGLQYIRNFPCAHPGRDLIA